ncbi:hypothetical protein GW17_00034141, partial [Ensete ventricosum]
PTTTNAGSSPKPTQRLGKTLFGGQGENNRANNGSAHLTETHARLAARPTETHAKSVSQLAETCTRSAVHDDTKIPRQPDWRRLGPRWQNNDLATTTA